MLVCMEYICMCSICVHCVFLLCMCAASMCVVCGVVYMFKCVCVCVIYACVLYMHICACMYDVCYICLCVWYAFLVVYVFMCMHEWCTFAYECVLWSICACMKGYRFINASVCESVCEHRGHSLKFFSYFLGQGPSFNLELTMWLVWLASELQGSECLCFPCSGVTVKCHYA